MNFYIIKNRTINSIIRICLSLIIAFSLTACSSGGPKATASWESIVAQQTVDNKKEEKINEKLFASARSAPEPGDYIIGEGDLLQISVFDAKELNTEARVGDQGFITLPLIDAITVSGLTTRQAEQKIAETYRKKYLENPHVGILVKENNGSKITLLGELHKPGTYTYFSKQRVLDVLALGGGFTSNAGRVVQVRRVSPDVDNPTTFLIDMDSLIKKGRADLNIEIERGDVIFVPEADQVYVDGAVRRPGNYPIQRGKTIDDAIRAAGGFFVIADDGNIKVVRFNENGQREVVQLTIKEVRNGAAGSFELKDRDIVYVEKSDIKRLFYGLRINAFMDLVGIGYTPPEQWQGR